MTDIAFLLVSASGGGAERAMIGVANHLVRSGLTIDLVLVRKTGPFLADVDPAIRIVDLGAGAVRRTLLPLNNYVNRARPQLLVSALASTDPFALVGKALFRWKTKLHISVQNAPSASEGVSSDAFARRWPRMIRLLYRFADSINAISQGVAHDVETIMGKPAGSIPVINNPVDIRMARDRAEEPSGIEWLAKKNVPVLLAVGRLIKQKDLPTLFHAFAQLRNGRKAKLVILGEGPDRASLEALARELKIESDVLMPGFAANPFAAMAAADLFVLASRWEGFANVVAEALACGTKVVSTDCPSGPAEILDDGRFGALVPVGDAAALAAALDVALDSKVDRDRLRTRAEAFSLDHIAESYLELFRQRGLINP